MKKWEIRTLFVAFRFMMGVGNLIFSSWNLLTAFQHKKRDCLVISFLILWANFASICSVIPIAYYRIKLIKSYHSVGIANIMEPAVLKTSLALLWFGTFAGSLRKFPIKFRSIKSIKFYQSNQILSIKSIKFHQLNQVSNQIRFLKMTIWKIK